MILIIGGAYQGKLSFAVEKFGLSQEELHDLKNGYEPDKPCYYHLELYLKENLELPEFSENAIVIAREINSGVVPIDKQERLFKERYGKTLQILAKSCDKVYRVYCGIPQLIFTKEII